MNSTVRTLLFFLVLSCTAESANAQIRDDESSKVVLAVQCAVSSGYSASDFDDYSRRLAKTLSLLTSSQQKKVFGYLPQPAAVSSNDADTTPISVSPERGSVKNTDPGLLAGLVGDFNNALIGATDTTSAVYAGEPASPGSTVAAIVKGDTAQNLEQATNAIAGSRKSNSSWDSILSWLSSLAAKARLK